MWCVCVCAHAYPVALSSELRSSTSAAVISTTSTKILVSKFHSRLKRIDTSEGSVVSIAKTGKIKGESETSFFMPESKDCPINDEGISK